MFGKTIVRLDDKYTIQAEKSVYDIAVGVFCKDVCVGKARLTTDNVDVSCVTELSMEEKHVKHPLSDQHSLGDAFIKFLLKCLGIVRKPEFRFILNAPESLQPLIAVHQFDRGENTNVVNEILIRRNKLLTECPDLPQNISLKFSIDENQLDQLLFLLQKNAYWQKNLTLERLKILISSSLCVYAISDANEIVGFSRVLTNRESFASLWDVVVSEDQRGKNIGTAMMHAIFSHKDLRDIPNWILFTDSAKRLYEKFGFVAAVDIPHRKLIHKLRFQDSQSEYMHPLIQVSSEHFVR